MMAAFVIQNCHRQLGRGKLYRPGPPNEHSRAADMVQQCPGRLPFPVVRTKMGIVRHRCARGKLMKRFDWCLPAHWQENLCEGISLVANRGEIRRSRALLSRRIYQIVGVLLLLTEKYFPAYIHKFLQKQFVSLRSLSPERMHQVQDGDPNRSWVKIIDCYKTSQQQTIIDHYQCSVKS